jgi:hypothetical protein
LTFDDPQGPGLWFSAANWNVFSLDALWVMVHRQTQSLYDLRRTGVLIEFT